MLFPLLVFEVAPPEVDDYDDFFSNTIILLPSSIVILIYLYPVPVGAAKLLDDEGPGVVMFELLPTEGTTDFA